MTVRRWLAVAIAINAGAAIPWWIALAWFPTVRGSFRPAGVPDVALLSFALPDLLLYAFAGLFAAYGLWRGAPWAHSALLIHTGAACYAALYTAHQYLATGEAALAAAGMLPSLLLLPYACWRCHDYPRR